MLRVLLLLVLVPLAAQDLQVVHLSTEDAAVLASLGQAKAQADANWRYAEKYLRRKYLTEPGVAEAGKAKVEVENPKPGWDYGVVFSQDYSVMVARTKPCEAVNSEAQ
jgi:hypothetical protein